MTNWYKVVLTSLALALIGANAHAAIAIDQNQPTVNGAWSPLNTSVQYNQSFTAGANNVAGAGIYFDSGSPSGGTMTLEIWDGLSGLGGTLLATGTTNTDTSQLGNWVDVFWTPVSLTIGNPYYLHVTGDTQTYYAYGAGDPYAGGSIFRGSDGFQFPTDNDLTFRTYYDTTYVPVPAAFWLFGSALLGLVGLGRRRSPN